MSLSHILADQPLPPHAPAEPVESDNSNVKAPYRSWRKKFRKLRLQFNKSYSEGVSLIKDEHKALSIARRLQEQNDQLLDLLLDLNESTHMPPQLRFSLRSPSPSASAVPSLEPDTLELSPRLPAPTPLTTLTKTPHTPTVPSPTGLPPDLTLPELPGYLTPSHEDEYLSALDVALKDVAITNAVDDLGRPLRPLDRPFLSEKDLQTRNPNSVYNWLRRNQPDVFIQERETAHAATNSSNSNNNNNNGDNGAASAAEKHVTHGRASGAGAAAAAGPPHRGPAKRASMAAATPRAEQELLDEEIGFVGEGGGASARGKRSRDDEPYRPKGGSSRPSKRKREELEKGARKKVARGANGGAGGAGAGAGAEIAG